METVIHARLAQPMESQKLCRGSICQTTTAKAAKPSAPREAPAASMLAAMRPRLLPSRPMRCLCCFSCFSIRLAPAGKIAGKARKRPPIPGPKRLEIMPAATVQRPPKKNRTANSWGLIPFRAPSFAEAIISVNQTTYRRSTAQTANEVPNQMGKRAIVAVRARGL
jgi:hypothetical protein